MPKHTPVLVLAFAIVVGAVIVAAGSRTTATAEDERHIVYLNITGEGATAKAWYRGAPPAGVGVQEALDTFSEKGYRVASVSPSQRPIITAVASGSGTIVEQPEEEQFFIVLLERP